MQLGFPLPLEIGVVTRALSLPYVHLGFGMPWTGLLLKFESNERRLEGTHAGSLALRGK